MYSSFTSEMVLVFLYLLVQPGVLAEFTHRLTDVVENLGGAELMTFTTEYTAPDLVHILLNGTNISVVANGVVNNKYSRPGYSVASVRGEHLRGGYIVTINISNVVPQDAGTYVAADDNGRLDARKNYIEFVVTDGEPTCKKGPTQDGTAYVLTWQFTRWGHVNGSISFLKANNEIVCTFSISATSGQSEMWTIAQDEYDLVSTCVTVFFPSSRCSHCTVSRNWTSNVTDVNSALKFTTGSSTFLLSSTAGPAAVTTDYPSDSDDGLSGHVIFGIVLAVVVAAIPVSFIVYKLYKHCQAASSNESDTNEPQRPTVDSTPSGPESVELIGGDDQQQESQSES